MKYIKEFNEWDPFGEESEGDVFNRILNRIEEGDLTIQKISHIRPGSQFNYYIYDYDDNESYSVHKQPGSNDIYIQSYTTNYSQKLNDNDLKKIEDLYKIIYNEN